MRTSCTEQNAVDGQIRENPVPRRAARPFISLRTKFIGFVSVIIITVCSGLSWYFIRQQERGMTQALLRSGTILGTNLAHNSRYALFTEDLLLLNQLIDGVLQVGDVVYVVFTGPEGRQVAARSKGALASRDPQSRTLATPLYADPVVAKALLGRTSQDPVVTPFVAAGGEDLFDIAVPVLRRGPSPLALHSPALGVPEAPPAAELEDNTPPTVYGVVQLGVSQAQMALAQRTAIRNVAFIAVLVMFGGVVATVVLARRIITPLRILTGAARQIALGDLAVSSAPHTNDEVGQLSEIFSQMTQSLRERDLAISSHIDTITALTQTLEQRVVERTRELQEANQQLAEASRHKSEFVSTMSHELRTPLDAIIGFCGLVLHHGKEALPKQQYANLEKILLSAERLLILINNLLDLSKIEAGRMEVQPISFALTELIDECLQTIEPMRRNEQIRLGTDLPVDETPLFTDRDKLHQILINLLGNAIKFTERGTITVRVHWRAETVAIGVTDTGIGIPVEELEGIFAAFRQLDSGPTRKYTGTGLGLSISRQLARLLGGDLTVHSTVGKGSTFTVTIPLHYSASKEEE